MDTVSLSDIAAVTRGNDNDGWGNGGAWWIIILFLFVFMGGGFWGNRNGDYGQYATAATQQEILFGQQFGQLNDRLTSIGNGICSLGYDVQGNIGQLGKEMALAQNGTNMTISAHAYVAWVFLFRPSFCVRAEAFRRSSSSIQDEVHPVYRLCIFCISLFSLTPLDIRLK